MSALDMLRRRQLRAKTLTLSANWFSAGMLYYGLSLNSAGIGGGDAFLTYMINGALEVSRDCNGSSNCDIHSFNLPNQVPAYTSTILIILFCGRRLPYAGSLCAAGVCLLCACAVPPGLMLPVVVSGKFFVTISFAAIYLYTSELYPTVLRTTGVGWGCFCSRLGGAAASWVALLSNEWQLAPPVAFGTSALVCGLAALALPETRYSLSPSQSDGNSAFPSFQRPEGAGHGGGERDGQDEVDQGHVQLDDLMPA